MLSQQLMAQSISGRITNEKKEPIPFANIFVRELNSGTSTDSDGNYFLNLDPGQYEIVISSIGYESLFTKVPIGDGATVKNYVLVSKAQELEQVIIKASKRDPAYEIIQNAVQNREKYFSQLRSFKADVYTKAVEVIDIEQKEKKKKEVVTVELATPGEFVDPFDTKDQGDEEHKNTNMVEIKSVLYYQAPNDFKEERNAYKLYGTDVGLYLPNFSETDFNFYQNLVEMKGLAEASIISPLSRTSILTYRFRLEKSIKENGLLVHEIKVTPRKSSNSTFEGLIYINDSIWNINRLELTINKSGLKFYDKLTIKQDYQQIEDGSWNPYRLEFDYFTKSGKRKSFEGNTLIFYQNIEKNIPFPPKFFGNEVSVITKEAYKRDSSYWKKERPEPLTITQKKVVSYRDSIYAAQNDEAYLDSIEAKYNKITFGDIIYDGIGKRNIAKKKEVYFGPLLSLIEFEIVGGWRIGPYGSYFKRWESGKILYTSGSFSVGLKNKDVLFGNSTFFRYNPYKLGDITIDWGRQFYSINSFDAYLNQLRISNYILNDYVNVAHRIELVNGLYISTDARISFRSSVADLDGTSILNEVIDETDPLEFEPYDAFITETRLAYTPKQRFMSEPNRKIILGSKYPTFSVGHRKGWPGVIGSDINFDYVDFSVEQDIVLGVFGNSRYKASTGKFLNTKALEFVDLKRFRESDPILYSDPLNSFQLLNEELSTTNEFIEFHHIHHFNGALINNLPLIKKLKFRVVAGAGAMYIKDLNYFHREAFVGLERVFKLGARRRLRIGVYGAAANSNKTSFDTDFKVSFDIIDTWKKVWSY